MSLRPSSPPTTSPAWLVPAFLTGAVAYAWLFFAAQPDRLGCLPALLLPDEIVLSWMDGHIGRFDPLDRIPVLLASLAIWTFAFAFGRLTLRGVGADHGWTRLERTVFSLGIGLSELSLLTLILGLAGLLSQAWLFVLVLAAIVGACLWPWRQGKRPATAAEHGPSSDWWSKHGLWLGLPFLMMILLGGMMPPWDFDVREYHLQVPKEWFLAGRITFLPHNVYGNMPLGAEMHALLGAALWPGPSPWWWGALVGKTVMGAFAPLTAMLLVAAGRRLSHPMAGIAAGLIYIATPWTVYIAVTGLNEGALAFYLAASVYTACLWNASDDRDGSPIRIGRLLTAGFCVGSAVACKYPAALFLALPLGAWILLGRRRLDWKPAVLFSLAIVCACGPWLAKNAVLTGNPVYPLVFGGRTRTPERMEQWNRAHRVPQDAHGRRYTVEAAGRSLAQVGWQSPWLSPLVLPFAALAFAGKRWRRLAWWLGLFAAYNLSAWWLCTHRIDRFWVPLLPVLCMLAGLGIAELWQDRSRQLAGGILIAGLAWCCLFLLTSGNLDRRYLVSLTRLRSDVPIEPTGPSRVDPVHRWLNRSVPDGQCVLLVGDAEPFDLEVPALYNTCFDENLFENLFRERTRDERVQSLRELGISHVYVRWSEIDRYRQPGNYGYTDYVTRDLVRGELARDQQILQAVDLGLNPEAGEVFAVSSDLPSSPGQDSASPARPR